MIGTVISTAKKTIIALITVTPASESRMSVRVSIVSVRYSYAFSS
jgi:hypothetical protein